MGARKRVFRLENCRPSVAPHTQIRWGGSEEFAERRVLFMLSARKETGLTQHGRRQAAGADNPAAPRRSRIIYLNRAKRRSEMRSDVHSGMSLGGRIIVSPVASSVFFKDIFFP